MSEIEICTLPAHTLIVKKITSSATSTTKQTVYLIFLFELIHVGKFIRILRGQHLMKIMDNASGIHCILIKVFPDTPYVSVFDCLKICKKTVFRQQIINGSKIAVNRAVIDEIICVFRLRIELFHLHIDTGSCVILAL